MFYKFNNSLYVLYHFNDTLRLNHYKLISEDYYKNNKCVRGGGESGLVITYTMDSFKKQNKDFLEIKDDVLCKKN